jgi:replicative DNA helicase
MQPYHLASEHSDQAAERALLAAIAADPTRHYWSLIEQLSADLFFHEADTWDALSTACQSDRPPILPAPWPPAPDPVEAAARLAHLHSLRLAAQTVESLARAVAMGQPHAELLALLEADLGRLRGTPDTRGARMAWASDLLSTVLADARDRRQHRETSGRAITGLSTGLSMLDDLLNGWNPGLYLLGGAPGVGKTTLSWLFAQEAARQQVPVVYVSFENSPQNLVQKALCAHAAINSKDVDRGFADLSTLARAGDRLKATLDWIAIVEGTRMTVAEIRGRALQAMRRHQASRCFIVLDYLQRAAAALGDFDHLRHSVDVLAGELRDVSNRLNSPVLALASQNRAGGKYAEGGGASGLDSLKESGGLEYGADAVMFLVPSERPVKPPCRSVDLVIRKNRFGELGDIPLVFRPEIGLLREEASSPYGARSSARY